MASPTAPSGKYTRKQLLDALPSTKAELHGAKLAASCTTFAKICPGMAAQPGMVYVSALGGRPDSVQFTIVDSAKDAESDLAMMCPEGKFDQQPRDTGTFTVIGRRGTGERTPVSAGAWQGFACHSSGTTYSDTTPPGPFDTDILLAWTDHHQVSISGSPDEAASMLNEFVARLDAPQ